MKRFISRMLESLKGSRPGSPALAESRRVRLGLEDLEGRQLMSASPLPSLAALPANLQSRLAHLTTPKPAHAAPARSAPAQKVVFTTISGDEHGEVRSSNMIVKWTHAAPAGKVHHQFLKHGEKLPPGMIVKPIHAAPAGKAHHQFLEYGEKLPPGMIVKPIRSTPSNADSMWYSIQPIDSGSAPFAYWQVGVLANGQRS